ncbi:MAG: cytochrome c peroxidase [Candidatus Solibacter sp.]
MLALFQGCAGGGSESASIDLAALKAYAPLPDVAPGKEPVTEEKVVLGRMLYYEIRLSANQKLSCNSCHDLTQYGVDNQATSVGDKGQHGDRNSPTVYNAAGHFVQFWDGRAADVEEQAKGPVLNPVEMAMTSGKQVVAVLNSMPEYVAAFQKAFPNDKDPVTYDNTGKAIGAFERKLITPARWDKFLKGEQTALTAEEKAGFHTFVASGCQTCHAGALLGGNMYQKIGLVKAWPDTSDTGRYNVTKSEGDKFLFKVPSLRNIDKTGPYFHDGKIPTLDGAVAKMADHQVGKTLSAAEIQSIVTWMKSLTGEIPADYIKRPDLPKSTSETPKPTEAD